MDELEIGGKRYVSSRRAAKEHKYHIDYIGQLIRAGKVMGKKVGRAWYVEEGSLQNYLAQENEGAQIVTPPYAASEGAPVVEEVPAPMITKENPMPTAEVIVEMEQEIIREEMQEAVTELKEAEVEPEPVEQKIHINIPPPPPPVQKLRNIIYVEDNEPMLPVLDGRANADFISIPMRRSAATEPADEPVEESVQREIPQVESRQAAKKTHTNKIPVLIFAAAAVLIVAAIGSSFIASSITIDDGKPASVGFTIK